MSTIPPTKINVLVCIPSLHSFHSGILLIIFPSKSLQGCCRHMEQGLKVLRQKLPFLSGCFLSACFFVALVPPWEGIRSPFACQYKYILYINIWPIRESSSSAVAVVHSPFISGSYVWFLDLVPNLSRVHWVSPLIQGFVSTFSSFFLPLQNYQARYQIWLLS